MIQRIEEDKADDGTEAAITKYVHERGCRHRSPTLSSSAASLCSFSSFQLRVHGHWNPKRGC
ncbi:uncharacterized protein J3R85_019136 [Psidium guajava]|nr:uncharacterized protein J3R85_019136 [Psidium guajava]